LDIFNAQELSKIFFNLKLKTEQKRIEKALSKEITTVFKQVVIRLLKGFLSNEQIFIQISANM